MEVREALIVWAFLGMFVMPYFKSPKGRHGNLLWIILSGPIGWIAAMFCYCEIRMRAKWQQ